MSTAIENRLPDAQQRTLVLRSFNDLAQPIALIAVIGIVIGYGQLLAGHFYALGSVAQYQHFPFILAAVVYLFWTRWRERTPRPSAPTASRFAVMGLLALAWAVHGVAVFLYEPWFAAASAIVLTGAGLLWISRSYRVPGVWAVWLILWLLVPLDQLLDASLTVSLQSLSSRVSSHVLDLIGVNHLMRGNVLELPARQLFVDEACSGIVSVMSVIACAMIFAVWARRSAIHILLLLLASVGWAITMNIARITTIAATYVWWDWDLSEGMPHEILGLILFCVTFVAMISTDRLLAFTLSPIGDFDDRLTKGNFIIRAFDWLSSLGSQKLEPSNNALAGDPDKMGLAVPAKPLMAVGIAFGVLGVVQLVAWGNVSGAVSSTEQFAMQIGEDILPPVIGEWKRRSFEVIEREKNDNYGEYSKFFVYDGPEGLQLNASFDFPFTGSWHDVTKCYVLSGWTMSRREVKPALVADRGEQWNYIEAEFVNVSDRKGFLVFSIFDRHGEPASPPAAGPQERIWRRLRRRGPESAWPMMYQAQVWIETPTELSEPRKEQIRQVLLQFRAAARQSFINAMESSSQS
jgi:exosortase